MSRRGQGNGPALTRSRRVARRSADHVRTTDVRDIGIRPGAGVALGLADPSFEGPPEHNASACSEFGCPSCLACGGGR